MSEAILYSRFSSIGQADGHSVERQLSKAEEFCRLHNLTLSEKRFSDLGLSGWANIQRNGLESLLDAIQCGKIKAGSYILVEATDRLSRRGFKHVLDLVERLVNTGCKFVTIDNGQIYDSSNINRLNNALPLIISADLAKEESDRKSERVKQAKANIRKNRMLSGAQPFWIDLVDGKAVFNDKMPIAKQIVDRRIAGKSYTVIAKELNEQGIRSSRGKAWSFRSVIMVLSNTAIYGAKTYYETIDGVLKPIETVANVYPPLCTYEEFKGINVKREYTGRTPRGALAYLLKCGHCGRFMASRQNRHKHKYRFCSGLSVGLCQQASNGWMRDSDQSILAQLKTITIARSPRIAVDYEPRIAELETQMHNFKVMREKNRGNIDILQMIMEEQLAVKQELAKFKKQKEEQACDDVDMISVNSIEDDEEKNKVLRNIIERIDCYRLEKKIARYTIIFKNGFTHTFIVKQLDDGSNKVMFNADMKVIVEITDDREEWEKEADVNGMS
ncbi:recombinase [Plesiomonas shigelloides]|uniref:recombinase family protein n=1 Tax=Plesiomonas shigelloides TaxID=703 RepID=UPI000D564762|nr:recombinase family protein [Plesiomonas shigelloides]PVU64993.1 recombinase [Plesiomonas shigelloides]